MPLAAVSTCGLAALLLFLTPPPAAITAFTDVTVIPMSRPGVLLHQTVVTTRVCGGRPYELGGAASRDRQPGRLLRMPQLGTITVGAPAEFLLLDGNPADDLDALTSPTGFLLHGTWIDRATLRH